MTFFNNDLPIFSAFLKSENFNQICKITENFGHVIQFLRKKTIYEKKFSSLSKNILEFPDKRRLNTKI